MRPGDRDGDTVVQRQYQRTKVFDIAGQMFG